MKRSKLLFLFLLVVFVLAACAPQPAAPAAPGATPVVGDPMPAAVEAARAALAERLGIPADAINVVDFQQVDWSDSCLGLGGPAESCLAEITPGYEVTLEANGEEYVYRTNLDGSAVRAEESQPDSAAVEAARQALAERLGIQPDAVNVVDFQQVDWSDSCLGLGGPAELCLAAITPGYQVTLEANGEQYVYRTNLDGTTVRAEEFQPDAAAADMALHALAERLGVEPGAVMIISQLPAEWPDACLGLPAEDELCAEVITPGFEFVFQVGEEQYVLRTNEDGSNVRFGEIGDAMVPAAESLRDMLSQILRVELNEIEVVSAEAVDWPDACLGVQRPDVMCAQVITPGFRIVLGYQGEEYVFHTNETATAFVLASAPQPSAEEAVIVWEERDEGCSTVLIGELAQAYGPCEGELMPAVFATPDRLEELQHFVETYAPFEAETPAGVLTFNGEGEQEAGEAVQRAIAEWSRLVFMEAREGRNDTLGAAIAWNREGGIAGFCDNLQVNLSGVAYANSCQGNEPESLGKVFLSEEQLEQLYGWLDNLQPVDVQQTDPAVADAMTIGLVFNGMGERQATPQDQQAILDFANDLLNQFSQNQ